jgi:hypothetical protein
MRFNSRSVLATLLWFFSVPLIFLMLLSDCIAVVIIVLISAVQGAAAGA